MSATLKFDNVQLKACSGSLGGEETPDWSDIENVPQVLNDFSDDGTGLKYKGADIIHNSPKIEGLILSNNYSDVVNDIDISQGYCSDSTRAARITLTTALTKRLDASWSAGNNAGMLQSGQTKAVSKSYRIYIISSADGTDVDIIATEYNIPISLPSGYTIYRYIGSIRTTPTGAIQLFTQVGNTVILHSDKNLLSETSVAETLNHTVSKIPLGLTCPIIFCELAQSTTASAGIIVSNILPDNSISRAFAVSTIGANQNQVSGFISLNIDYQFQLRVTHSGDTILMYVQHYVDLDREAY